MEMAEKKSAGTLRSFFAFSFDLVLKMLRLSTGYADKEPYGVQLTVASPCLGQPHGVGFSDVLRRVE